MGKGLEYVRNQITKLKDDLQHYTMVEKDSALANQIRYDLEQFEIIEKELKALEIIRKKNVDTRDLFVVFDWFGRGEEELALNDYNSRHKTDEEYNNITLTLEEFDLLKEVLLCH